MGDRVSSPKNLRTVSWEGVAIPLIKQEGTVSRSGVRVMLRKRRVCLQGHLYTLSIWVVSTTDCHIICRLPNLRRKQRRPRHVGKGQAPREGRHGTAGGGELPGQDWGLVLVLVLAVAAVGCWLLAVVHKDAGRTRRG